MMDRFGTKRRASGLCGLSLLVLLVAAARCSSGKSGPVGGPTAGVGGSGQGGSAGQAGAGAGGSSGGAGGSATSCSGCGSNQVCVGGACVSLPSQCPCPVESYCDLATSKCVVGCTSNSQCDTGRACNTTNRSCVNGCRDDASCGTGNICDNFMCRTGCRQDADCGRGSICVNTVCQTGCAATSDCTATGQTCVSMTCQCPSAQMVCNNACTRVDTVQNCGTCGTSCGKNQICTSGQCMCPNGTCQPETVYTTTSSIGGLWIDGGSIYTVERVGSTSPTFQRIPLTGGSTSQLVATVPAATSLSSAQVAGGRLVFAVNASDSISGVPSHDYYDVPTTGGTLSRFDSIADPFGSPEFVTDGTVVYYWDYNMYNTASATLYRLTFSSGSLSTVGTYYDDYYFAMLLQGSTVYMPRNGSNSSVGPNNQYSVYTTSSTTTLTDLFYVTTATLGAIMVDSTGFYSSEISNTTKAESLVHTPINGKNPVTLAAEAGRSLTTDDMRLYYRSTDSKSIRRVLKTGGTPETFVSDPAGQLYYLALNGGYVYFVQGASVKRLSTSFQP